MSQFYNVHMEDMTHFRCRAASAGEAIWKALDHHRGSKAVECWCGEPGPLDSEIKGRIIFEVPPHNALPLKPAQKKAATKQKVA